VREKVPFILKSAGLVVVYLVSAKIGMVFGTVNSSATIFWPPGGIALAILLLGGIRYLPSVFVAAYLAAVMVDAPFVFALGSSVGNTLESCIGYFLLIRFYKVDLALNRVRDLYLIFLLGGLIPAIASTILGPVTLMVSGLITADALPDIMWRWWRSDVLGIAFFTPLILVIAKQQSRFFKSHTMLEMSLLWVSSFVIGQSIFLGWHLPGMTEGQALGLPWAFPLLIWAGLRSGRRNAGLVQLMFVSQAMLSAHLKIGYFADDFARYGLANFWMFGMLLAVAGMTLAIQSTAQRKAKKQIALNAKVFSVSHDGIVIVDTNCNIVDVNPAFTEMTGYTREEVLGKNPRLLSSGRQTQEFYAAMWKSLNELGHWEGELWNRRKDGSLYLEKLVIRTVKDTQDKVINRVGIFSDITLSKAEQESVTHHAQHDYLTNLPNRLLFSDRFNQQLAIAKRHGKKFAVIFLDLDQFKPVNDSLGHQQGDKLLIAVAQRLASLVREIDTVSRFGGDEFAILVSEVNEHKDVTTLAEKILATLNQPFHLDGHTVNVSGSLGIAMYPDHGSDMDAILGKADSAMYQAKRCGKNTYC
jgi:diguanylate cyclase (GGDEF)-like protein/PAS domain S-box-containing protein